MVDVEIRSYNWVTKEYLQLVKIALRRLIIHPYDNAIKELAIKIRRSTSLKIPDAFIAATSLALQLPLFSGDEIFKKVEGLKFIHVQF